MLQTFCLWLRDIQAHDFVLDVLDSGFHNA